MNDMGETRMINIAVVGAGVVGLSSAINIQNLLPGAKVKVIADKFGGDTTSIGAGGIFRPNLKHTRGVPADTLKQWSMDSWKFYSSLALSSKSSTSGHMLMPGYIFSNEKIENEIYQDIVFNCREISPTEMEKLKVTGYKYGYQLTSIITQMSKYLPWLMEQFRANGGQTEERKINDLRELCGYYDVVVNCTGLGSRKLVNDDKIYPVRGQIVKLNAPWQRVWVYTDDDIYMLPNSEFVTVGGVRQKDNYDLNVDSKDRQKILDRAIKFWPPLEGASIIGEWVGLRPVRTPLRVEKEVLVGSKGSLKVVHNYGHGGHGITLSWGTSVNAAKLVKEHLMSSNL